MEVRFAFLPHQRLLVPRDGAHDFPDSPCGGGRNISQIERHTRGNGLERGGKGVSAQARRVVVL